MQSNSGIKRTLFSLSLAAICGGAYAEGLITNVQWQKVGEGVEVRITGTDVAKPTETKVSKGTTYIASFDGTMKTPGKRQRVEFAGVDYVQWTQFSVRPRRVSRVVLHLNPDQVPTVHAIEGGWAMSVNVPEAYYNAAAGTEATISKITTFDTPANTPPKTNAGSAASGGQRTLPAIDPNASRLVLAGSVAAPAQPAQKLITLDFLDTDIIQALNILASQSDYNIIAAPDVKGTVNLRMKNVTVDEALTLITATHGLRYQKIGRTIIVATPDRIGAILQGISTGPTQIGKSYASRVIPIFSHQGKQLKAAMYRVVPQDSAKGRYEIVLPSEQVLQNPLNVTPDAGMANQVGGEGAGPGGAQPQTNPVPNAAPANNGAKPVEDDYIIVIGTDRLDEVAAAASSLDKEISRALGIETPQNLRIVQKTYSVRGTSAMSLITTLGVKDGMLGTVKVVATPATSTSEQAIVLSGRELDVDRVLSTLQELDSVAEDSQFIVYEVKTADPRSLKDTVNAEISGVKVILPPAGVGNDRIYGASPTNQAGNGNGTTTEGAGGSSTAGGGSQESGVAASAGIGNGGIQLPFSGKEPYAVPMRLILRGKPERIAQAMSLLAQLDREPVMAALEVRVMSLTKEEALNTGINWDLFTGGAVKFLKLDNSQTSPKNQVGVNVNSGSVGGSIIGTLDAISNKNNLIARPNMTCYDGRETEVFIGDVIRYIKSVTSSQNGPSVEIDEIRVGVNLSVLARISDDGTVTMDMRPMVSSLKGFTKVNLNGFFADLPQTSEIIDQKTVAVKSGETIAIGGLISDEVTKQTSGIPFLKDLPIIGRLFMSSSETKTRREIVIFVTVNRIAGALGSQPVLPMMIPDPNAKPAGDAVKAADTSKPKN